MIRVVIPFLIGFFFWPTGSVRAQETPEMQLEFLRQLRAKGYNDLALEHAESLKKIPALQSVLPLETARTLLAMARDRDPDQRAGLFAAARTQLEQFVTKNPGTPESAEARLEIARLAAYAGQSLLTKAMREEDNAVARKAEQQFLIANKELLAAEKLLGDLAEKYTNPDPEKEKKSKQQLDQSRLQARVDRAKNFLDQASTYLFTASDEANRKRAEAVDEARKAFEAIIDEGGEAGALANAWLIKSCQEATDPGNAAKYFKRVMGMTGDSAKAAQRWARLFYIQGILKDTTRKEETAKKLGIIVDESKKWLSSYPAFHKSPEGYAVRFELGKALYAQAQAQSKEFKSPPPGAMAVYLQAQKHFADIAASDSELAEKANQFNIQISVFKMGEKTAVAELRDFDECFLKAQVEHFRWKETGKKLADAAPNEKEDLEKALKEHHKQTILALRRALYLAEAKTPPAALEEARFLLAINYLIAGDHYRAGVAGEALAKVRPPSRRSSTAAGYAIESYAAVLQRDNADANRTRLKDLADFILSPEMQKHWAGEPVSNVARYQLAMLHFRDGDNQKAVEALEKLTPDFAGYVFAQSQLVFIALDAIKEKAKSDDEKKWFEVKARQAILRTPNPGADADPNTATLYFSAQLEQAGFLYADAAEELRKKDFAKANQKYFEMQKFVADLKSRLNKTTNKMSGDSYKRLELAAGVMASYARLGLAEVLYRGGQYDKVLADTKDTVARFEKLKGDGKAPIRLKDYVVSGEVLGLALRANVQKGNIAKAEEILSYLDRLAGEEENALAGTTSVLRSLIDDLRHQVHDLKQAKDEAKLKTTVANFSAFLDKLAGQAEKKGLQVNDIMFLANCYYSLDQYCRAAGLFEKIQPPKALAKDKLADTDEQEVQTYWYIQVQYARALRLCSQEKDEKERKDLLKKANFHLETLKRHKHARLQLYAEKEQLHILEDSSLYGLAIKGWGGLMKTLSPRVADDAKLKEMYFEAYYQNVWCMFKYSQTEAAQKAKKEKEFLRASANQIVRLENSKSQEGWQIVGQRFVELLDAEPKLKDAYEELKKAAGASIK